MKAFKHLIQFALSRNCAVSVWDGEAFQVKRSRKYKDIVDAVESVEEAALVIRDALGSTVAHATVQPFGLEDDETVVDWVISPFMSEWEGSIYQIERLTLA